MDFLQPCAVCYSHSCRRSSLRACDLWMTLQWGPNACDLWMTLQWGPNSQRLPVPSAVLGMYIQPLQASVLREPCVVENILTEGEVTEPHEGFYTGISHFAFTKDLR